MTSGRPTDQFAGDAGIGEIGNDVVDIEAPGGRRRGLDDVGEDGVRDARAGEDAVVRQALDQLAAEHARRAYDQDPHRGDGTASLGSSADSLRRVL